MPDRGKTFIKLTLAEDWQGPERVLKVTIKDVIKYFVTEARSMSGCRSIAGEVGGWRPIDNIAQYCLEYFKQVNIDALRREGRRNGLTPKF